MSTIKANTLLHSDGSTTNPPAIPALDQRMAKAWVEFSGTGTIAVNNGYNVSSLTDHYTGNYSVNFTTTLASAYYATSLNHGGASVRGNDIIVSMGTSAVRVETRGETDGEADSPIVSVIVFAP